MDIMNKFGESIGDMNRLTLAQKSVASFRNASDVGSVTSSLYVRPLLLAVAGITSIVCVTTGPGSDDPPASLSLFVFAVVSENKT